MKNPYLKKELKYFMHTFKRQPLLIKRAKGAFVWDEKGKKYIDFYSGLAVCGIGHNHPKVVNQIKKQSQHLLHCSNFFLNKPQMALAKELTKRFGSSKIFFSNSGAEANEWAIKLARLWATKNKKKGRDILVFKGAFHGRTLATTAATDRSWKGPFDPLPRGFRHVRFNDLKSVKKAANTKSIGILVEPVQGEGGIRIASKSFLKGLAQLCKRKNLLLMIDEIQTGMGRTGTFFAFQQAHVTPHIVTLAKGLAGGLPLAATLAKPSVAKHVAPGLHGSTFGGNPVSCAASLEVCKLLGPKALQTIRLSGQFILNKLNRFKTFPSVKSVRGMGLMLAIELKTDGAPYVSLAREKGLLINCTQGNILRFLPPYFMSRKEVNHVLKILKDVFTELSK